MKNKGTQNWWSCFLYKLIPSKRMDVWENSWKRCALAQVWIWFNSGESLKNLNIQVVLSLRFKCSGTSKDTNPPCKFITLKLSHSVVLPGRLFHLVNLGELKFWNPSNKNTKKSPLQLSNTARISSPSGVFTAARPAATNWFTEENPVTSTGYDLCLSENKLKTYLTIWYSDILIFILSVSKTSGNVDTLQVLFLLLAQYIPKTRDKGK